MYVAMYARSSGNGADLEEQLERIRKSLDPEDIVVGSYVDSTAGVGQQRPGLEAAIARLGLGNVGVLWADSMDRLARTARELAVLEQLLWEKGVVVKVVEGNSEAKHGE